MSTTDNKVKIQLRSNFTGSETSISNRQDKSLSPSKLMINHGKPNYTINRSTPNLKGKPLTADLNTFSSLALPLITSSQPDQLENVVLKHVEPKNLISPSMLVKQRSSTVLSSVSPGISSKAAATSFGVKLKQCTKNNFQNDKGIVMVNKSDYNNYVEEEPEFVKRQKQIFGKLYQREHHQLELTTSTCNFHQNDVSQINHLDQSYKYDSKTSNINCPIKISNRCLENVSSDQILNNPICTPSHENQQDILKNSVYKLPKRSNCLKPAIPGKPANLQIPTSKIITNQQNNLIKFKIDSIYSTNKCSEAINSNPDSVTSITTVSKIANSKNILINSINDGKDLENLTCISNEQKTILPFTEDLLVKSKNSDPIKMTKAVSNGSGIINCEDEDDDVLKEFIANENSSKLAEDVAQSKFEFKIDEEDSVTSVVTR